LEGQTTRLSVLATWVVGCEKLQNPSARVWNFVVGTMSEFGARLGSLPFNASLPRQFLQRFQSPVEGDLTERHNNFHFPKQLKFSDKVGQAVVGFRSGVGLFSGGAQRQTAVR